MVLLFLKCCPNTSTNTLKLIFSLLSSLVQATNFSTNALRSTSLTRPRNSLFSSLRMMSKYWVSPVWMKDCKHEMNYSSVREREVWVVCWVREVSGVRWDNMMEFILIVEVMVGGRCLSVSLTRRLIGVPDSMRFFMVLRAFS